MAKWTGFKIDDLKVAIDDLQTFALEANPKFLQTLKYKFNKDEYMKVASIPFLFAPKALEEQQPKWTPPS